MRRSTISAEPLQDAGRAAHRDPRGEAAHWWSAPDLPWRVRLHSRVDAGRQELLRLLIIALLVMMAGLQRSEALPVPEIGWGIVLLLAAVSIEAARRMDLGRGDVLLVATAAGLQRCSGGGRSADVVAWADLVELAVGEPTTSGGVEFTAITVRGGGAREIAWTLHVAADPTVASALVRRAIHCCASDWRSELAHLVPSEGSVWDILEGCPSLVTSCPACRYRRHGLHAKALCPECGAAPPGGGEPVLCSATRTPRRRVASAVVAVLGFGALICGVVLLTCGGILAALVLAIAGLAIVSSRRRAMVAPSSGRWTLGVGDLLVDDDPEAGTRIPWAMVASAIAIEGRGVPMVRVQYAAASPESGMGNRPRLATASLHVADAESALRIQRAIGRRVWEQRLSPGDRTGPPGEARA